MWQASVTIKNNTDYNLTIDGVGPGNTTIGPNSTTSWLSQEVHNTKSLLFWVQENVWYMQGNLSFGPEAGVYVDRGWMADDEQTQTETFLFKLKMVVKHYYSGTNLNKVEKLFWNLIKNKLYQKKSI
jgi:hypothetical protein